jgi:hypothetical protein
VTRSVPPIESLIFNQPKFFRIVCKSGDVLFKICLSRNFGEVYIDGHQSHFTGEREVTGLQAFALAGLSLAKALLRVRSNAGSTPLTFPISPCISKQA